MSETRDLTIPTVLLLDVETSDLYRDDLAIEDEGQPWAIQIAAALMNKAGVVTNHMSHIIRSEGRRTKEGALKVHGISDRAASQVGIPQHRVIGVLTDMLKTASFSEMSVVTFGDLDRRVIASLLARYALFLNKPASVFVSLWFARPGVQFIDLQRPYCQQLCKLPSQFPGGDYKWPTLDEAASLLLGRSPREGFHDAYEDIMILRGLYLEVSRRGLLSEAPL